MLQIVTRMYFSDGVPVRSTVHRDVLYTNCTLLRTAVVELRVGQLAPSTSLQPVSSVTLSVTEHLEAEEPDGTAGDARRDGRNRTDRRGPLTPRTSESARATRSTSRLARSTRLSSRTSAER